MKSVPQLPAKEAEAMRTDAGSGDVEGRLRAPQRDAEVPLIYRAGERARDACPAGGCG